LHVVTASLITRTQAHHRQGRSQRGRHDLARSDRGHLHPDQSSVRTRTPASISVRSFTSASGSPRPGYRRRLAPIAGELALGRNVLVAFMPGAATTLKTRSGFRAPGERGLLHLDSHRRAGNRSSRYELDRKKSLATFQRRRDMLRDLDESASFVSARRSNPDRSWLAKSRRKARRN